VGNAQGRDRYFDHPVGSALTRRVWDDIEFIELQLQVETDQGV
jgi:hypothetical protein